MKRPLAKCHKQELYPIGYAAPKHAYADGYNKKNQPELPVYVNGVRSSQKGLADIDPETIAKMMVYRDEKTKTDDPEKSGYISIITKGNEESDAVKLFNEKCVNSMVFVFTCSKQLCIDRD